MTADDEPDERVLARLRDHFDRAAAMHAVPAFDAMLVAAESAVRPSRHWRLIALSVAVAASLAVVALQLRSPRSDPDAPLIAELSSTTYWTAPSDRWPTPRSAAYLGLPRFDDMSNAMNSAINRNADEVQTWF